MTTRLHTGSLYLLDSEIMVLMLVGSAAYVSYTDLILFEYICAWQKWNFYGQILLLKHVREISQLGIQPTSTLLQPKWLFQIHSYIAVNINLWWVRNIRQCLSYDTRLKNLNQKLVAANKGF